MQITHDQKSLALDGWLGRVRVEFDMQPPPRGEFWDVML